MNEANKNADKAGAKSRSGCSSGANAKALAKETVSNACVAVTATRTTPSHDHHAPNAAATVRDPVCGMTVDPATSKHRFDYRGETYPFLLGRLPHQIRRRSRFLSGKGQQAESRRTGRHDLHLPDASGDPPGRPGKLPDLRHGAGAGGREPRCAAQSGARAT